MELPDHYVTLDCIQCHRTFPSPAALANHLNDGQQDCRLLNIDDIRIPIPSAFLTRPDGTSVSGRYHTQSGYIYGRGNTLLDKMKDNEYERRRKHQIYYPFADEGEWELARFLAQHLTQSATQEFLKLKWFQTREKPSFTSAEQMLGWIDALPGGPEWKITTIDIEGFNTEQPIRLVWRDALEVVHDIFSNPIFANYMTYDPYIVYRGTEREYGEFFSADRAHHIQDQLPKGATMVPIIIASDKKPVERHSGGLEMHPIFVTIGNIQSDIRMQATSHAWQCVGFMPVPTFEIHPDYQTLLSARLFHHCMDIIFGSVKAAAQSGVAMNDPLGYIRNCHTPLVAYIADLLEQQLIACVAKNASPVTMATQEEFGDPYQHEPRTGACTLKQLKELCEKVDPWDLVEFQKAAKAIKLLGVHLPFFRDWKYADPAYFLNAEVLHTCDKWFFDHPLEWCKEAAGNHLLDTRYKNHHKRVGVRHFSSGISHIKQMTGKEHRDVQRTLVPTLAGAGLSPIFIYAIRRIIEFIYMAQNPTFTTSSLTAMVDALQDFHATKHAIIEAEARRGTKGVKSDFNIPKLELMQSFKRNIKSNGSLIQYAADVSERLLITHCKIPFERTNRHARNFVDQIVQLLNREENLYRFNLYHILRLSDAPLDNAVVMESEEVAGIDPTLSFVTNMLPEHKFMAKGPRPHRDFFSEAKGIVTSDGAIAYHVTVRPDSSGVSLNSVQDAYGWPDIMQAVVDYINSASSDGPRCFWDPTVGEVNLWNKFRIQLHSSFRSHYIMRSQVVQACPPSNDLPYGCCDAVLLSNVDQAGSLNVALVRSVFSPKSAMQLPAYLCTPLLYVEFLQVVGMPDDYTGGGTGVGLYKLQRVIPSQSPVIECHAVVPITDVLHSVELIPVYGTEIPGIPLSSETSLEAYTQYYLNSFADKEIYHVLHH